MKNKRFIRNITLLLGASLCLSACGSQKSYKEHLEEYVTSLDYHDNYHVVQIADLHWSNETDLPTAEKYFKGMVEEIKSHYGSIDLFEFTGDQFMLATRLTVDKFRSMMKEIGIPYAMVFGNHDRECTYSLAWLTSQLKNDPLCIYKEIENDDLYGHSNFIINLNEGETTKWQLYNLDSGASYLKSPLDTKLTYDYLRDDQFDFVSREHISGVPGIAYYHIAQKGFAEAYKQKDNLHNKFFKLEEFGESNAISDLKALECAKENEIKGIFVGHAHSVDWTVDYEGVTLGFGVKTGKELYYGKISKEMAQEQLGLDQGFDLQGASVVTLKADKSFDLDHLYYNLNGSEVFTHWENYNA